MKTNEKIPLVETDDDKSVLSQLSLKQKDDKMLSVNNEEQPRMVSPSKIDEISRIQDIETKMSEAKEFAPVLSQNKQKTPITKPKPVSFGDP